jgi:hypothetical protein
LHNGEHWRLSKRTNLIGFTIQSIVEGSDVTVDSEEFVIPVETSKVDEWMKSMEEETDFYWERDNLQHWKLTGPDEKEYYFKTGWGDPKWEFKDGDVPENVKKKVIDWIEERFEDGESKEDYETEFKFGVKGWTVSEYIDDSTL